MLDVDTGSALEHFTGKMPRGADAGRSVVELSGCLSGKGHEFVKAAGTQRRMNHDRDRRHGDERDWREIPHRVIGQFGVQGRIDRVRSNGRHQEDTSVGCGFRNRVGTERAACSTTIVDHDR